MQVMYRKRLKSIKLLQNMIIFNDFERVHCMIKINFIIVNNEKSLGDRSFRLWYCYALDGARFSRGQVPNPPGSGMDVFEGKGVHREVESKESRMCGIY